jgi:hypothetical protein
LLISKPGKYPSSGLKPAGTINEVASKEKSGEMKKIASQARPGKSRKYGFHRLRARFGFAAPASVAAPLGSTATMT